MSFAGSIGQSEEPEYGATKYVCKRSLYDSYLYGVTVENIEIDSLENDGNSV